ncbi:MAG: hypothetical protein IIB17_09045 [Chloroflexi bacterium]|nr:hypothetical protein [Chloroflexota bacterium]
MTYTQIRASITLGQIVGTRRIILLVATLLALITLPVFNRPSVVLAHPLGNFTVNRYSRIEPSNDSVKIRYVLDMAEIPAFTEMLLIDTDNDGVTSDSESKRYALNKAVALAKSLYLTIDGSRVDLKIDSYEVNFPSGQGGLNTLRLGIYYSASLPDDVDLNGYSLEYQDRNFPKKLGWKELLIQPTPGLAFEYSTLPNLDVTNELTEYPQDMLTSPLNLLEGRAVIEFSVTGQPSETRLGGQTNENKPESNDILSSLISADRLTLPVVVISLLISVGLGALHAMSPGHGKTIMAAYLVGTRGTAIHAIFLGVTVTATHTIGVVMLGLVVLYASHVIAPEALYSWLSLASGFIIVGVGGWLLITQLRQRASGSEHGRSHDHSHDHGHHQHGPQDGASRLKVTWTTLTALGITGGLIPSASALVILLAAVSMHRIGFGMVLILAFGAGMAGVLTGVGLALVYIRNIVERMQSQHRLLGAAVRFMPLTSALVVLSAGIFMSARSAMQFA